VLSEAIVVALSEQLLRSAAPALLDASLDALGAAAVDQEAGELLRALHEAGEADTLRQLLASDRLTRFIDEMCNQREEQALCAQLRHWLGEGQWGQDDPARLVTLAAIPATQDGLRAWAQQHAAEDLLRASAARVVSAYAGLPEEISVLDCCLGRVPPLGRGASLLGEHDATEAARRYLQQEVSGRAALSVRQGLWKQPLPDGVLRALAERLRALLAGARLSALHTLRFVPARPVSLEVHTGTCFGVLRSAQSTEPCEVKLWLSGFEQRALEGACERCDSARCLHVQALAARLMDAVLLPEDRLHAVLLELARVPSWKRFVGALSASETRDENAQRLGRLSFRIRMRAGVLSVGAFLQKPMRGGGFSVGRQLSAQSALRTAACADRDKPVLDAMSLGSRSLAAQFVSADMLVLRGLIEHPHVQDEDGQRNLRVAEQTLHVELVEQPEGLLPRVSLAGTPVAPGARPTEASYVFTLEQTRDTLIVAALTPPLRRLLEGLEHFRGVLPPESYRALSPFLASVRQVARVTTPKVLEGCEREPPRKLLLRVQAGLGEGIELALSMRALPLSPLWPPGQGPTLVHGFVDGQPVFVRRDLDWERLRASEVLETLRLSQHVRLEPFAYRVEDPQASLEMLSAVAQLSDRVELEWAESARAMRVSSTIRRTDLKVGLFKKGEWFVVRGGVHSPEADLAIGRLLEAARRGERFVPLGEGNYAEIEQALFERLRRAQLCVYERERENVLSPSASAFWLDALGEQTEVPEPAVAAWLARSQADLDAPPVFTDNAELPLRDYQRDGVRWLLRMSRWAPGACLADDMGLGKTVQAIALLRERAALGPALVVAPTSVVNNWLTELARFAPDLSVSTQPFGRATALSELGPSTVRVVSYELLLRDQTGLSDHSFATQIIDEAQMIKNARTQRAEAVARVKAQFRLALSGTPVENRLGDLWSLFHVLTPGLLGSWERFRAVFAVPIERYERAERAADLKALVAPFMLRRTKQEVASELPLRTEVVHTIELSTAEQDLYDSAVRRARAAVGKRRGDAAARNIQILAELTRLRMLACHPRLVLKEAGVESSKLAALMQLLEDILPRGHRALLFSQFTQHLALVREALEHAGISYLYLDGATSSAQRKARVDRFQAGEGKVFLISLKAGGTGLNLTAADYVVHLDPWWNPAAEDQASDRAHRIGQDKPVTIVKLVAQGTIEERVLGLHAHKRRLAEAVLSGAEGMLDAQTIEALLLDPEAKRVETPVP
jgi:superfamily II DNA or RNA helicase